VCRSSRRLGFLDFSERPGLPRHLVLGLERRRRRLLQLAPRPARKRRRRSVRPDQQRVQPAPLEQRALPRGEEIRLRGISTSDMRS